MRLARLSVLLLAASSARAGDKPDPSAEFFKPTGPVPVFKITVEKAEADSLRREPRKYVKCTIQVGDQTLKDVAVHLNNSVQDPTYLNEILCGEMAVANGLPAARGTHAVVELNGRKLGFYVLKEGFNKTFLRRHFADPKGNLYDGGFLQDIDAPLKLDTGTPNEHKDLKALAKACQEPNADKRFAALDKVLDVDRMATNAALQVICTDWDGYCRNRNNYRVYFDPKSGKAVFIPHGMDQMFQNPGDAIWPGWGGLAARALLETPEGKKRFIARLKEMTEKSFTLEKWYKRIDELVPRAREAMEAVQKGSGKNYDNEVKAYKDRLKQRVEFLAREVPKLK